MKISYINDEFFGRLETLALNLGADLSGYFGGKHRTRTYGQTVEFADYREYMLGDDIRRIDWNLFSRFEKYFLKLFTDERQMHMQVFLDCSASMGKINPQKAAYAVGIAAALGFLSVHNMDRTSYKLMREGMCEDLGGTIVGKNSFFRTIGELENVEFSGEADISAAVTNSSGVGTSDGLTVIISDFFTERDWKKAVDYLCYKRRQVLLIQVVTPEEADPGYSGRMALVDSEAEAEGSFDPKNMNIQITPALQAAYEEAFRDLVAEIKDYCVARGADFVSVRTDKPIEKALFGELLRTGIMV